MMVKTPSQKYRECLLQWAMGERHAPEPSRPDLLRRVFETLNRPDEEEPNEAEYRGLYREVKGIVEEPPWAGGDEWDLLPDLQRRLLLFMHERESSLETELYDRVWGKDSVTSNARSKAVSLANKFLGKMGHPRPLETSRGVVRWV